MREFLSIEREMRENICGRDEEFNGGRKSEQRSRPEKNTTQRKMLCNRRVWDFFFSFFGSHEWRRKSFDIEEVECEKGKGKEISYAIYVLTVWTEDEEKSIWKCRKASTRFGAE